jgi:integrase
VRGLAKHDGRSPDALTDEEVQAYLLYLIRDRQRSWSTCNIVVQWIAVLVSPHAFATHLLEAGVDLHTMQRLRGHKSIPTTTRCWHLTHAALTTQAARLELLPELPLRPPA